MTTQEIQRWTLFLPMKAHQEELKEAARFHNVTIHNMISITVPELVLNSQAPKGPEDKIFGRAQILLKIRSLPPTPVH